MANLYDFVENLNQSMGKTIELIQTLDFGMSDVVTKMTGLSTELSTVYEIAEDESLNANSGFSNLYDTLNLSSNSLKNLDSNFDSVSDSINLSIDSIDQLDSSFSKLEKTEGSTSSAIKIGRAHV